MKNNFLTYLLSLIGFIPITEQVYPRRKQHQEECQYLKSSEFIVSSLVVHEDDEQEFDEKKQDSHEIQAWLSRLSKITLCQILTSTMNDYPQVIDGIYSRHYEKIYYAKNKPKEEDTLVMVQQKARSIAHQLDNLRPSEQFGRAHEVATQLQALVRSLPVHDHSSFISLFGLIILAQESLLAPTEVRQHIFYHAKLGRTLILEMSSLLKDFKSSMKVNHQHYWSSLNQTESWLSCLEQVCSKLSRYDITWEYRKEYQDVLIIAERYFKSSLY